MVDSSPTITLYLDGELSFQLQRRGFAGTVPTLKIQMHETSNPITLAIPGYQRSTNDFNLPMALRGGLFDLFDASSNTKISIPSSDEQPGEIIVKAGAGNQWFDLKVDPQDEFWTALLTPGRKYELRWADGSKAPWAYLGEEHKTSPERLSVRLLPRPIKLTVFDDATAPPQFSISLTPTDNVCHLNGEPRFGFKLKITSHEKDPITVCLNKTPLKELHGLEEIAKVEDEDGEEVDWPWGIGCFEGREPFPSDDMFEEFRPEVPYERMFWLEKINKETSNGGELEELQAGSKYKGEVSRKLLGAFTKWRRGTKKELLHGGEKDKEERWKDGSGRIVFEVSDPFMFEAV